MGSGGSSYLFGGGGSRRLCSRVTSLLYAPSKRLDQTDTSKIPNKVCPGRELDAGWYRRHVGVVSQDPRLFSMTVAENIAYGCPRATRVGRGTAGSLLAS
jgi:ABC-type ATPase involved in cell division